MLPSIDPESAKSLLPKIYDDGLSPSVKQFGKALENATKVGRFFLAPIDYLASLHDRFERYLEKISEKVKPENLIEGSPQIVIPTIEGLSLTNENSLLGELFLNLLTNSIDRTKQDLAHPAFPSIISQLSHDEAIILFYLKLRPYSVSYKYLVDKLTITYSEKIPFADHFPFEKLIYPNNIEFYMEHLVSLNLVIYEKLPGHESLYEEDGSTVKATIMKLDRKLSGFGALFAQSCIPDEFEGL